MIRHLNAATRALAVAAATTATVSTDGITEDPLFTSTVPGGTLARNGDRLDFQCRWTTVAHATATRAFYLRWGGQQIAGLAVGATPTALRWTVWGSIIRTGADSVRAMRSGIATTDLGACIGMTSGVVDIAGVSLAVPQAFLIAGVVGGAGAAAGDMQCQLATLDLAPAQ